MVVALFLLMLLKSNEGGIAALIYDDFGSVQHGECEVISALNPLEAELQAIKSGMSKALELGWKDCCIFSDCKVAVLGTRNGRFNSN